MRFAVPVIIAIALNACIQSTKVTQEYINPPINLTISLIATQTHRLSFTSDNREGGFAGYGIFTGASSDEVNAEPGSAITTAQLFCSWTSQAYYAYPINMQVGPSAAGVWSPPSSTASPPDANLLTLCKFTGNTLTSGTFVAIRARVERTTQPWSTAAVAQVP